MTADEREAQELAKILEKQLAVRLQKAFVGQTLEQVTGAAVKGIAISAIKDCLQVQNVKRMRLEALLRVLEAM
jgi:hypothetical protein